jgi:hypothetical protein
MHLAVGTSWLELRGSQNLAEPEWGNPSTVHRDKVARNPDPRSDTPCDAAGRCSYPHAHAQLCLLYVCSFSTALGVHSCCFFFL